MDEEYRDKVVTEGFTQQEVVDLNETLPPMVGGFSQEEGVSLDAPAILGFSVNEIVLILGCSGSNVDFNLLFDRSETLVPALYPDSR